MTGEKQSLFQLTIRVLSLLALVVAFGACGCGRKARAIRDGMDKVDKHAAEVEAASRPGQ